MRQLKDVEYNFKTGKFEENGKRFTDEDFVRRANKLHELSVRGAPGWGTLKVAVAIGTIVRQLQNAGRLGASGETVASKISWAIHSSGMAGTGEADQRRSGDRALPALKDGEHETGITNT